MVATAPQNMPATNSPVVDPDTGFITQPWLALLTTLWNLSNANSGGGGGSGTFPGDMATVADLQALTNRGTTTSFVVEGYYAPGDNGGGIFVYVATDTTSADNGGTIIVDGDGNRWYRLFTGAACVQWFGAVGNGVHDDTAAIQATLDAHVDVFVPAGDWPITSISMGDKPGRKFRGAGSLATTFYSNSGDGPAIICPSTIYYMEISGFYLERLGGAVAFDDGIQTLSLLASPTITDVVIAHQYVGYRLQAADSGFFNQSYALGCVSHGILLANLPSGAGAGQCQWLLTDIFSSVNGGDGFRVEATGVGPAQIALGTWTNCQSFANTGHGVAAVGQPGQPINGLRLQGGFFGEDGASEIYLDTYGGGHVLQPSYLELAGTGVTGPALTTPASHVGSGIQITINNDTAEVKLGVTNGHSYDGLISACESITITGGAYQNNGLAGTAGRQNGIYLLTGTASAAITGCRMGNVGGSTFQHFGLASEVDCIAMAACDLRFNTSSWYALPSVLASNIAACLPFEANEVTTNTFHALGQSAFANTLNITAGGIAMTTGVVGNGIVTDNIFVQKSLGVGVAPTGAVGELRASGTVGFTGAGGVNITGAAGLAVTNGIVGQNIQALSTVYTVDLNVSGTASLPSFSVPTLTVTSDLISTGQTHLTGTGVAVSGGLNVTSGGAIFSSVGGNGITVDNVTINTSLGVGVAATGVAGQARVNTDLIALGQLHSTGAAAFAAGIFVTAGGGVFTAGVAGNGLTVDNITANVSLGVGVAATGVAGQARVNTDLISLGQLHITGAAAFAGGLNITAGGATFTAGVGGNGVTVDNVTARVSAGVGTNATGVAGRLDTTTLVASGGVSGTTGGFSGAVTGASYSGGTVTGTTITSSVDLIANGQFHGNGASAFAASLNLAGSLSMTGVAGITCANVSVSTSVGVGTFASGAAGVLNVTSAVQLNGVPYTNP